jgi:hypothetical protein
MVKKAFILLLILLLTVQLAGATSGLTKLYPPGPVNSGESLQVWKVTLTADALGALTYEPTQDFYGKLYSVQVMHGNSLTGTETLAITTEYPYSVSLLSYNVVSGNATSFPRSSTIMYPLAGALKFTLTNTSSTGANSANFYAILTLEA